MRCRMPSSSDRGASCCSCLKGSCSSHRWWCIYSCCAATKPMQTPVSKTAYKTSFRLCCCDVLWCLPLGSSGGSALSPKPKEADITHDRYTGTVESATTYVQERKDELYLSADVRDSMRHGGNRSAVTQILIRQHCCFVSYWSSGDVYTPSFGYAVHTIVTQDPSNSAALCSACSWTCQHRHGPRQEEEDWAKDASPGCEGL